MDLACSSSKVCCRPATRGPRSDRRLLRQVARQSSAAAGDPCVPPSTMINIFRQISGAVDGHRPGRGVDSPSSCDSLATPWGTLTNTTRAQRTLAQRKPTTAQRKPTRSAEDRVQPGSHLDQQRSVAVLVDMSMWLTAHYAQRPRAGPDRYWARCSSAARAASPLSMECRTSLSNGDSVACRARQRQQPQLRVRGPTSLYSATIGS